MKPTIRYILIFLVLILLSLSPLSTVESEEQETLISQDILDLLVATDETVTSQSIAIEPTYETVMAVEVVQYSNGTTLPLYQQEADIIENTTQHLEGQGTVIKSQVQKAEKMDQDLDKIIEMLKEQSK